jgi:hypothetical protein
MQALPELAKPHQSRSPEPGIACVGHHARRISRTRQEEFACQRQGACGRVQE